MTSAPAATPAPAVPAATPAPVPAPAAPTPPPPPSPAPKHGMGWGPIAGAGVLLLIIAAAVGAYYYYTTMQPQFMQDDTSLEPAPALNQDTSAPAQSESVDQLETELNTSDEAGVDGDVNSFEQAL